jgi:two-component system, cell cycle sensor histidine kinase and response regulator CckA
MNAMPVPQQDARRILLVEDEEVVRDVVTMMLEQHGFEVVAVEDALAALSACRGSVPFDLLLTDLVMPTMNGVELAAAVQDQAPHTRVVYMSGYSAEDVTDSTPRVQKPFTSGELLETLERVLA